MAEPLILRCCCGHARRSHVPRWTWHHQRGHGIQRQAEPPGVCRYCACPGYYAPLVAAAERSGATDGQQAVELGRR